jgi:hypothetical protein
VNLDFLAAFDHVANSGPLPPHPHPLLHLHVLAKLSKLRVPGFKSLVCPIIPQKGDFTSANSVPNTVCQFSVAGHTPAADALARGLAMDLTWGKEGIRRGWGFHGGCVLLGV